MKTQASIAACNYRLQEWAQMIQECNNRPTGMSVSEWCQANSITPANYYYRMSQVRKACLDSLSNDVTEQAIVLVPKNLMLSTACTAECRMPESDKSFIEVMSRGMMLRIHENASITLIEKILGALTMAHSIYALWCVYVLPV